MTSDTRPALFSNPIQRETPSYFDEFRQHLVSGLLHSKPFILLISIYWIIGFAYLTYFNQIAGSHLFIYVVLLGPLLILILPAVFIVGVSIRAASLKHRRKLAFRRLFASRNVANFAVGVILMIMLCVFMGMFTAVKSSFATLQGFQHDVWQADLDKLLFFGNDPWQVLFVPFHSIFFQKVIELNYNICWHILVFAAISFAAYSDMRSEVKIRYLVSMVLVWMFAGSVFAGLFISAGPAFYGFVTGDELRFGAQLDTLALYTESTAVKFQEYLWLSYETANSGFGTGISAFPSVHVSVVAMNVFFAFEINRKIGFIALAYALFVGFSSVYLAWHYAIDGIFGAMIVGAIYYTTRAVMKKKPLIKAS
jgi:membrane-associated phospholipid phosphatase